MGLNKPITVGGGLTAAEVQTIIDAQTTAIAGKVDAQTNTLKTDIPSSISGGASISDINAALDEKLPQYAGGAVVKSKQLIFTSGNNDGSEKTIAISTVDTSKCHVSIFNQLQASSSNGSNSEEARLTAFSEEYLKISGGRKYHDDWLGQGVTIEIIEFY